MLVEEDDSLRDILREVLQASEKAVQAYGDSQEANQALKKLSFDVVITDLGLKKGQGRGGLDLSYALFIAQSFDRVQLSGLAGRVEPKKYSYASQKRRTGTAR